MTKVIKRESKLTVYTLPTCPKCKILKKRLEEHNLPYTECQDVPEMQKLGIMSTPALMIEGRWDATATASMVADTSILTLNGLVTDFQKMISWVDCH